MYPKHSGTKGSGLIPALLLLAAMLLVLADPVPAAPSSVSGITTDFQVVPDKLNGEE